MRPTDCVIFGNGNVMVFDENGEQMPELQRFGMRILHLLNEIPDVKFHFGFKDRVGYASVEIPREAIPGFLQFVKKLSRKSEERLRRMMRLGHV